MRRRLTALLLAVIGLLCCGCGAGKKDGYLDADDRAKLEGQLLKDLQLSYSMTNPEIGTLSLANHTGYDLADLYIRWAGNMENIVHITRFPNDPAARLVLNSNDKLPDKARAADNQIRIGYIIGAYRYVSKPLSVGLRTEEKIEIVVETEKGAVILEQGGTTRFPAGNEINGLFSARITALTTNVNVIYGGQFQLSMDLEGRKPSDGRTLVYKLYDSDGIVLESNSAYFTENTAQLYFIDADVMAAGRYVLRFEELD